MSTDINIKVSVEGTDGIKTLNTNLTSFVESLTKSMEKINRLKSVIQKSLTTDLKFDIGDKSIVGQLMGSIKKLNFAPAGQALQQQIDKGMKSATAGGSSRGGKTKKTMQSIWAEEFSFLTDQSMFPQKFMTSTGQATNKFDARFKKFLTERQKLVIGSLIDAGKTGRAGSEIRKAMKDFQMSFIPQVDSSSGKDDSLADTALRKLVKQLTAEKNAMKKLDALIESNKKERETLAKKVQSDKYKSAKSFYELSSKAETLGQLTPKTAKKFEDLYFKQAGYYPKDYSLSEAAALLVISDMEKELARTKQIEKLEGERYKTQKKLEAVQKANQSGSPVQKLTSRAKSERYEDLYYKLNGSYPTKVPMYQKAALDGIRDMQKQERYLADLKKKNDAIIALEGKYKPEVKPVTPTAKLSGSSDAKTFADLYLKVHGHLPKSMPLYKKAMLDAIQDLEWKILKQKELDQIAAKAKAGLIPFPAANSPKTKPSKPEKPEKTISGRSEFANQQLPIASENLGIAASSFKSNFTDLTGSVKEFGGVVAGGFQNAGSIIVGWMKTIIGTVAAASAGFVGLGYAMKSYISDVLLSTEKMRGYNIGLLGLMKTQSSVNQLMNVSFKVAEKLPIAYDQVYASTKAFSLISPLRPLLTDTRNAEKTMTDLYQITMALSQIEPEWGIQGAIFSLREALSGDLLSLKRRFEIPVNLITTKDGKRLTEVKNNPKAMIETLSSYFGNIYGPEALALTSRQFGSILAKISGQYEKFKTAIGEGGIYDVVVDDLIKIQDSISAFFGTYDFTLLTRRLSDAFTESYNQVIRGLREMVKVFGKIIGQDLDLSNLSGLFELAVSGVELYTKALKYAMNIVTDPEFQYLVKDAWTQSVQFVIKYGTIVKDIFSEMYQTVRSVYKDISSVMSSSFGISDKTLVKGLLFTYLFGVGNTIALITSGIALIWNSVKTLTSFAWLLGKAFAYVRVAMVGVANTGILVTLGTLTDKIAFILGKKGGFAALITTIVGGIKDIVKNLALLFMEIAKLAFSAALFVGFINGIYEIANAINFLYKTAAKLGPRGIWNLLTGNVNPQQKFMENLDSINSSIDEFNKNASVEKRYTMAKLDINDFKNNADKVKETLNSLETFQKHNKASYADIGSIDATENMNAYNGEIQKSTDLLKANTDASRMLVQIRENMTLLNDPNFGGMGDWEKAGKATDGFVDDWSKAQITIENITNKAKEMSGSFNGASSSVDELNSRLEKMAKNKNINIAGLTEATKTNAGRLQDVFKTTFGSEKVITDGVRAGSKTGHGVGHKMDFRLTEKDVEDLMSEQEMVKFAKGLMASGVTRFSFEEATPKLFKKIDKTLLKIITEESKGRLILSKDINADASGSHADVTFNQKVEDLGTAFESSFDEGIQSRLATLKKIGNRASGNTGIKTTDVSLMKNLKEASKSTGVELAQVSIDLNKSMNEINSARMNAIKTYMDEVSQGNDKSSGFAGIEKLSADINSGVDRIKNTVAQRFVEQYTIPFAEALETQSTSSPLEAVGDVIVKSIVRGVTNDNPARYITEKLPEVRSYFESVGIDVNQDLIKTLDGLPSFLISDDFKSQVKSAVDNIDKQTEKQKVLTESLKKDQLNNARRYINNATFNFLPNVKDYSQIFNDKIAQDATSYLAEYSAKDPETSAIIENLGKTFVAGLMRGKSPEESKKDLQTSINDITNYATQMETVAQKIGKSVDGITGQMGLSPIFPVIKSMIPDSAYLEKAYSIVFEFADKFIDLAKAKKPEFMWSSEIERISGAIKSADLNKLKTMTQDIAKMNRSTRGEYFSAVKSQYERKGDQVSTNEALTMGMMASASEFKNWSEQMYDIGSELVTNLSSTFETGFFDFMTRKVSNLGDMFKQMGQSVLDTILKIISKMLALQATKLVLGIDINAQGGMSATGGGLIGALTGGKGLGSIIPGASGGSGGAGGGLLDMLWSKGGSTVSQTPMSNVAGNVLSSASGGMLPANVLSMATGSTMAKGWGPMGLFGKSGLGNKAFTALGPVGIAAIAAGAFLSQKGRLFGGTVNNTEKEQGVYNTAQGLRNTLELRRADDAEKYMASSGMAGIGSFQFGANRYWETKSGNGITSKKTVSGNVDSNAFYKSADDYYKALFQSGKEHYQVMRDIDKLREKDEYSAVIQEKGIKERYLAVVQAEYATAESGRKYETMDKLRDKILETEDSIAKMLDQLAQLAKNTAFRTREFEAYKTFSFGADDELSYQQELLKITKDKAADLKFGTIEWYDAQTDIMSKQKELSNNIKQKIEEINSSFNDTYKTMLTTRQLGDLPKLQDIRRTLETLATNPQSLTDKKTLDIERVKADVDTQLTTGLGKVFGNEDDYYMKTYGKTQRDMLIERYSQNPKYMTVNVANETAKLQKEQEQITFDAELSGRNADLKNRKMSMFDSDSYKAWADVRKNVNDKTFYSSKLGSGDASIENELKSLIAGANEGIVSYYESSASRIKEWINSGYLGKDYVKRLQNISEGTVGDFMIGIEQAVNKSQFKTGIYDTVKGFESGSEFNTIVKEIQGMNIGNIGTGMEQLSGMTVGEDAWQSWYDDSLGRIRSRIENTKAGESEYFSAVNDLFSLMKEKADKLKEKAENSTQKMEDALTAIDETLKIRIAEERKSQKGDIIFMDTTSTSIDPTMIADLRSKIKNGDPAAAQLLEELKRKINGTSR